MTINRNMITIITTIASQIARQQTIEDLKAIVTETHEMYDDAKTAAEIAVKLFLRLSGMEETTPANRSISYVDVLVDKAEEAYRANYAG
jgi:hypothetical protein